MIERLKQTKLFLMPLPLGSSRAALECTLAPTLEVAQPFREKHGQGVPLDV